MSSISFFFLVFVFFFHSEYDRINDFCLSKSTFRTPHYRWSTVYVQQFAYIVCVLIDVMHTHTLPLFIVSAYTFQICSNCVPIVTARNLRFQISIFSLACACKSGSFSHPPTLETYTQFAPCLYILGLFNIRLLSLTDGDIYKMTLPLLYGSYYNEYPRNTLNPESIWIFFILRKLHSFTTQFRRVSFKTFIRYKLYLILSVIIYLFFVSFSLCVCVCVRKTTKHRHVIKPNCFSPLWISQYFAHTYKCNERV